MDFPSLQPVRSRLRLLLVDDSEINQLVACAMLARWGIAPVVAGDGCEAVMRVREQRFDLVLMDVDMPVLDGMRATEQIRRIEQEQGLRWQMPVVAYTSTTHADEEQLLGCGMTALLHKPCSSAALADCLKLHCADKFDPHAG